MNLAGEIKHVCTARPATSARCCIQESGLADRDNDTDPNATDKRQPGAREEREETRDLESRRLFRRIFSRTVVSESLLPLALLSVFLPPPLS